MDVTRGNCIFCEKGSSFKSREHVIPRWLLKELDILKLGGDFSEVIRNHTKDKLPTFQDIKRQTKNYDNYVSPYVCDDCNNGWMSRLESQIKPIMIPLIRGKKSFGELSKDEKLIISRWAIKTSMVIDSVDPSTKENRSPFASDGNKIRTMSSSFLPRGWAVFGMLHTPTNDFTYKCNSFNFVGKMDGELLNNPGLYRRTFIQFGHLILATAYLGHPNLILQAVGFNHYPLALNLKIEWLRKSVSVYGQKIIDLPDNSSENIALTFLQTISVKLNK